MPMPHGTHLGGIRTLEDLRGRCVIDSDTKCWVYRVTRQPHSREAWDINVWLSEHRRSETLQRAAWLLAGRELSRGPRWSVWRTCDDAACCNPAHLLAGTRHEMGAWMQRTGRMRGLPERAAINQRIKLASGTCVLTHELADWIRDSSQTGRAMAHALGCSPQVVSRVRLGRTWKRTLPAASVFHWRPAC